MKCSCSSYLDRKQDWPSHHRTGTARHTSRTGMWERVGAPHSSKGMESLLSEESWTSSLSLLRVAVNVHKPRCYHGRFFVDIVGCQQIMDGKFVIPLPSVWRRTIPILLKDTLSCNPWGSNLLEVLLQHNISLCVLSVCIITRNAYHSKRLVRYTLPRVHSPPSLCSYYPQILHLYHYYQTCDQEHCLQGEASARFDRTKVVQLSGTQHPIR